MENLEIGIGRQRIPDENSKQLPPGHEYTTYKYIQQQIQS
jgi:hypothetical protein